MAMPSATEPVAVQSVAAANATGNWDNESTTDSLPGKWKLSDHTDLGQVKQNRFVQQAVYADGHVQICKYDLTGMVKWSACRTLFYHGTAFTTDSIFYVNIMLQMALQLGSFCVMIFALDDEELKGFNMEPIEALLKQINEFVPFMLGYFVAVSLQRWWQLRAAAVGRVLDSFVNVSMFVACELHDEKWADLRTQIVKYGIASIELLWQAARNEDNLQDMQEKGLLTDEEISGLAKQAFFWQRPMTMWAWTMRICLTALDHNRSTAALSNHVMKQCIQAREGMALINAHLDTQLPFAYVHLICLMVNLQNVVFATVSGMTCAVNYSKNEPSAILQQVCACLLIGVVYQGIFGITYVILDPFGDDALDFPLPALRAYHASLVDAILKAQQPCPVVVQDGQLTQPRPIKPPVATYGYL